MYDLHEHPRRDSSLKDSMKMEFSKMRSESSECTWNAKVCFDSPGGLLNFPVQFVTII